MQYVLAALVLGLFSHAAQAAAPAPGDAERGATIYERCIGCHSLARNRTGPRHCGLIGRAAGTQKGYRYSEALRAWGQVWGAETLDIFLQNPRATVPGTKMTYAGVKDARERADLIAYLIRETGPGGACR